MCSVGVGRAGKRTRCVGGARNTKLQGYIMRGKVGWRERSNQGIYMNEWMNACADSRFGLFADDRLENEVGGLV